VKEGVGKKKGRSEEGRRAEGRVNMRRWL